MKIINFFPYRKGIVRGNVLSFPRIVMKSLENELAKMIDVDKDNHVCYLIEVKSFPENIQRGVMFTDLECLIGDTVQEKSW